MLMFFIKFFLVTFGILFIFLDIKTLSIITNNNIINLLLERQQELINICQQFQINYKGFNNLTDMLNSLILIKNTILFKILPLESLICFVIVVVLNNLDQIIEYLTYLISLKWLKDLFTFNWLEIIIRTFKIVGKFYGIVLITFISNAQPLSSFINSFIISI